MKEGRNTNSAKYYIRRFNAQANQGTYTCTASNAYGTVTHAFQVLGVQQVVTQPQGVPPVVVISPENIEAVEGSGLIINSTFQGTDPVTVTVEVVQPKRGPADNFIVDRNTKNIQVRRISKDMEGIYLVTATNPFGSSGAYFRLIVNESKC